MNTHSHDGPRLTRGAPEFISVVIPVRNAASTLPLQLAALAGQDFTGQWEVIVVDNGSTDDSGSVAQAFANDLPHLKAVSAPDRLGAAHARNVGAGFARGDFLAFCDADDVVSPGWLSELSSTASDYDIVGGSFQLATLLDRSTAAHGEGVTPAQLPGAADFLPHVFSSDCGIWTGVFRALGGWNELYLIGEDVELSWRAQIQGYRIGFAPDAVVWRGDPPGTSGLLRRSFGYGVAGARLHREFGVNDPRRNLREAIRAIAWLIANGPKSALSHEGRRRWANVLGRRAGRLAGSFRYRVFYP